MSADGIVQAMIYRLLRGKLHDIVGEEDNTCDVNVETKPYLVGDIVVPEMFYDEIDSLRVVIDKLASLVSTPLKDIFLSYIFSFHT